MNRKKWTPKLEITEELLQFREKRKWQLALRRYVIEQRASEGYAPYFGIEVSGFREWIENQFMGDLSWDNFASSWQFDHIVPLNYFNLSKDRDLRLCWNFINIRVGRLEKNKKSIDRLGELTLRSYFEDLYQKTNYLFCQSMLEKLDEISVSNNIRQPAIEGFIIRNKMRLDKIATFTQGEFIKLNQGVPLEDILLEREILKKFGG